MQRRRVKRTWTGVALAGVVLVSGVLLAVGDLSQARTALLEARSAADGAREALAVGDVASAHTAFGEAKEHFADAQGRLGRLPLRAVAALPVAGNSVATAHALARAGRQVAAAGAGVTAAVNGLPDGLTSLAPRGGVVPLEPLAAMADPLARARDRIADARALVNDTPHTWLVAPVREARRDFTSELDGATEALRTAAALARELPGFLGANGARRYFLGAQNPAELRGTGGLIGAYTVLTAEDGRLEIGEFSTITDLTQAAPEGLAAPTEDYERRYARFDAARHGSNINMTPDFPTAATAISNLYEEVEGRSLDGVVLADPYLLQALLNVVGPTTVPAVGTVDAASVVRFVTHDQYAALGGRQDRKEVLGTVAGVVLRRFLAGGGDDPLAAITALGDAAADGRLLVHAKDPAEQKAFVAAGVDGGLADPEETDYLAVVANNAAANKLDFYLERSVHYEVHLRPDGSGQATATIKLHNAAPTEGPHRTVLGPNVDFLQAGENRTYLSVYCAAACQLTEFRRDGEPAAITPQRELDRPVFSTTVDLASGQTATLELTWELPDAWSPEAGYRLRWRPQPTIRDTDMSVLVHGPDGWTLGRTSAGATVDGKWALWDGQGRQLTVNVDAVGRGGLAAQLQDALNRPLINLVNE